MKPCNVLFDSNAPCEHKKCGKMLVCDYMNQNNGMCMHAKSQKKPKRKNDYYRNKSDQTFALRVAQKEGGFTPDVLPYGY